MTNKLPENIKLMSSIEFIEAVKSDDDKKAKCATFKMEAYTGAKMQLGYWPSPVVVDVAGISVSEKSRPILMNHDPLKIVGHTSSVKVVGGSLFVDGVISGTGEAAQEVVGASKNGFPWQASIGASVKKTEFIEEGEKAEANGQSFDGPVYIIRQCNLGEISFCALGADDATSVTVAASAVQHIQGEQTMEQEKTAPVTPEVDAIKASRDAMVAEVKRQGEIVKLAGKYPEIQASAISEGWSMEKTELAVSKKDLEALKASRPAAPSVNSGSAPVTRDVIECAFNMTAGISETELVKEFGEQTVSASRKQFKRGLGLQETIIEAARLGGKNLTAHDMKDGSVIRAAFSSADITTLVGNAMNKRLMVAYNGQENKVDMLSQVVETRDFKSFTSCRLNETGDYEVVAPGAPILSGALEEETASNQLKTYGQLIKITRENMINDDLGALMAVPERLGIRAQAAKLKAWGAALIASSKFSSGNANLITGSALGITTLSTAEKTMMELKDAAGDYLQLSAKFLVVPPALVATARQLVKSALIVTGENATKGDANPNYGVAEVVAIPNISAGVTSGSDTTWYLFANPAEAAFMQIAYLTGRRAPVIEAIDLSGEYLGVAWRSYFDFGIADIDKRGVIKATA